MLSLLVATALLGYVSAQPGICSFQNSHGRIYMNNMDCTYYILCDGNTEHRISPCPINEVYDPWRAKCVPSNQNVNCTLDYYYFDDLCRNTDKGNVAMPDDCSKYLQCWDYKFVFPPRKCGHGTLFKEETGDCDMTDNDFGQCGSRPYFSNFNDRNPCVLTPTRGNCNHYCDCANPDDCRSCGASTYMSESKHSCVTCKELTIEEREFCNLTC